MMIHALGGILAQQTAAAGGDAESFLLANATNYLNAEDLPDGAIAANGFVDRITAATTNLVGGGKAYGDTVITDSVVTSGVIDFGATSSGHLDTRMVFPNYDTSFAFVWRCKIDGPPNPTHGVDGATRRLLAGHYSPDSWVTMRFREAVYDDNGKYSIDFQPSTTEPVGPWRTRFLEYDHPNTRIRNAMYREDNTTWYYSPWQDLSGATFTGALGTMRLGGRGDGHSQADLEFKYAAWIPRLLTDEERLSLALYDGT